MAERKTLHDWADTGLMVGLGLLLIWDISTTNSNTNRVGNLETKVTTNKNNHSAEVSRSTDKDNDQEVRIKETADKQYNFNRELGEIKTALEGLIKKK